MYDISVNCALFRRISLSSELYVGMPTWFTVVFNQAACWMKVEHTMSFIDRYRNGILDILSMAVCANSHGDCDCITRYLFE